MTIIAISLEDALMLLNFVNRRVRVTPAIFTAILRQYNGGGSYFLEHGYDEDQTEPVSMCVACARARAQDNLTHNDDDCPYTTVNIRFVGGATK